MKKLVGFIKSHGGFVHVLGAVSVGASPKSPFDVIMKDKLRSFPIFTSDHDSKGIDLSFEYRFRNSSRLTYERFVGYLSRVL